MAVAAAIGIDLPHRSRRIHRRQLFVHHCLGQSSEPVLLVVAFTCVGNPESLDSVPGDARYSLVQVDICDRPAVAALLAQHLYDNQLVDIAASLKHSSRGELEITDVNRVYLEQGTLQVQPLGRGYAWPDTGTHDSRLEAGQFIATIEKRRGLKVACPEEIAFRARWIDAAQLEQLATPMKKNGYGQYLLRLLAEEKA